MKKVRKLLAVLLSVCTVLSAAVILSPKSSAAQSVDSIFISEICFDPSYEENNATVRDNDFLEYIEIKNVGTQSVDLSEMTLNYCKAGLSGTSWYVDSLVYESGNDGIIEAGEVWVIGIYSIMTPRLGVGYDSAAQLTAYWSLFNTYYSANTAPKNRALCVAAKSKAELWLTNSTSLPNDDAIGGLKLVSNGAELAAIEYSPKKYTANGYAMQMIYKNGSSTISGNAGCSPSKIFDYQLPALDNRGSAEGEGLDLLSMNVCYEVNAAKLPSGAEASDYTVEKRAPKVLSALTSSGAQVICLQEVGGKWWNPVVNGLSGYNHVGKSCYGKTDGTTEVATDTYNLIFYSASKYELLNSGDFWLKNNNTPSVGNKVCTWVLLKDKSTGTAFAVFNTHLSVDNSTTGSFAGRAEELSVLKAQVKAKVKDIAAAYGVNSGSVPVVLCGDFNTDEGSPMYNQIIGSMGYKDAKYAARETKNSATYSEWGVLASDAGRIIDYCFFTNGVDAESYDIKSNTSASDHNAVISELAVPSNSFAANAQPGGEQNSIWQTFLQYVVQFLNYIAQLLQGLIAGLG